MSERQHPGTSPEHHKAKEHAVERPDMLYQQRATPDEQAQMSPPNDAGGGISAGTLKDASGTETGGGIDTPTHAEEQIEGTIEKQQPLHQGTNAYPGGGADNGSNL